MGRRKQQRRRAKAKARRPPRASARPDHEQPAETGSGAGSGRGTSGGVSLTLQVNQLVGEALEDLESGSGHGAAADRLADLCAQQAGRRTVVGTVQPMLRDAVTSAWQKGWEPADLHRFAGREIPGAAQAVLLDAVADEMRAYAPSTIDPRWGEQLEDLGARPWWARDSGRRAADLASLAVGTPVEERPTGT